MEISDRAQSCWHSYGVTVAAQRVALVRRNEYEKRVRDKAEFKSDKMRIKNISRKIVKVKLKKTRTDY